MPGADPSSYKLLERNPFDIHVYFRNAAERETAIELRNKLQNTFSWLRFYPVHEDPMGPHPFPHWEADFVEYGNRDKWSDVIKYLEAAHGGLSILVHPHTEDGGLADHTTHAYWIGDTQALLTNLF